MHDLIKVGNINKSFSSSFVPAGFEGQCDFTNKCCLGESMAENKDQQQGANKRGNYRAGSFCSSLNPSPFSLFLILPLHWSLPP